MSPAKNLVTTYIEAKHSEYVEATEVENLLISKGHPVNNRRVREILQELCEEGKLLMEKSQRDVRVNIYKIMDTKIGAVYQSFPKTKRAYLLNFYEYHHKDGTVSYREGSEIDFKDFKKVLGDINFEVHSEESLTKDQTLESLNKFVESSLEEDINIVILMGHGKESHICASDGEHIEISDLENIIAKLVGHKILILVACRTDKKVIKNSDLLVAYSTLPGEPSPRDKATGTPFVQNMLKLLTESRSQDMLTLFQRLGVVMDKIGTPTETQIRGSTKKNYIG